jgi:hypothetical protein
MSSFFTAIVFWAIMKWEREDDDDLNKGTSHASRWIVLIFFLIGLSIGVHLLNLLAIPAIVFIFYFKRYKVTTKSFILATVAALLILGGIQAIIIPGVVKLATGFELFFVNEIGLPFNSGIIIYLLLLTAALVFGLMMTRKNNRPVMNTVLLCFTVLLIGYSTYFVVVIRSLSNPPMDQNNPENPVNLHSYLKREQYGDWPIMYGQYYNSPYDPQDPEIDGEPVYAQDEKSGKYIIVDDKKDDIPNYDKRFCTIFPRMWSQQKSHADDYQNWGSVKGTKMRYDNPYTGETEWISKPNFISDNLEFFFRYQIGWMYGRYFMWNFAGRQNDIQGHGNDLDGNWLCGIKFIDELHLGNQDKLPESITQNKAYNRLYCLPLLLGLIGLVFHFTRQRYDWFVVLLLFLFTGIVTVIYLNQYPQQPRERDYAYVASFYAFAIWIGLGVLSLFESLKSKLPETASAAIVTIVCFLAVPALMAYEEWDDHDRSNRYTCRDYASNYLNSCAPNAVLFTNGDNDTFPLWYAQEVEAIRTDVRVANLSLSNTDWYIEQMRRRAYESPPLPFLLPQEKYRQGNRDFLPVRERKDYAAKDLKAMLLFAGSDRTKDKTRWGENRYISYFPSKKINLAIDTQKVLTEGVLSVKNSKSVVKQMQWDINRSYIYKSDLMVLDIIAANNWERPLYFSATTGPEAYLNLDDYMQTEGVAHRLLPINPKENPRVNSEAMYDHVMNKFRWGGLDKSEVYMDENNMRMANTMRMQMYTLANALLYEGKRDSAVAVLKKMEEVLPERNVPWTYEPQYGYLFVKTYYSANLTDKANALAKRIFQIAQGEVEYFLSLNKTDRKQFDTQLYRRVKLMQEIVSEVKRMKQDALAKELEQQLDRYKEYFVS